MWSSLRTLPPPAPLPPPEVEQGMPALVSSLFPSSHSGDAAALAERYAAFCRSLQVVPHPGVLTFMRLHLAEFRPEMFQIEQRDKIVVFNDADMFAFCDFVLRCKQPCSIFEHWIAVDASQCAIGVTGVQMLMRVLQLPGCRVHTIDLANQNLGPRGAEEVAETLRITHRISNLRLVGSFIHDTGGRHFARLLADPEEPCQQLDECVRRARRACVYRFCARACAHAACLAHSAAARLAHSAAACLAHSPTHRSHCVRAGSTCP